MGARQEVAEKIAKRYRESKDKAIKGQILDEFVEVTGYNRHYAARKLRTEHLKVRESKGTRKKHRKVKSSRGRKQIYGNRIRSLVETIWELMDYSCGKRLASMMEDVVDNMDRHGKLALTSEDHALLMQISPSTIDRMLSVVRKENGYKGRSHTQHGALLKEAIKIRTFADWVEQRPGFVEIDLVGHEGGQASGDFFFTLNMVDVNTGWVAMQAIKNKSQQATVEAIEKLRRRLPFPLLGIDCDNGSEFINAHLLRYCGKRKITFTRGRPYKKNDNCYVEQSNFVAVRSMMGYVRYEYPEELELKKSSALNTKLLIS